MKNPTTLREEAKVLRLLSMLTSVDIPIREALELAMAAFPPWEAPLKAMLDSIEAGNEVSDGIKGYEQWFSSYVPLMIHCGENSGSLDVAFAEASRVAEKTAMLVQVGAPEEKIVEINFLRLLGGLIGLGCPILQTLKGMDKIGLRPEVAAGIYKQLCDGETITSGLKPHPDCFDQTTINYIDIAEQTGSVPTLCERAAQIKEQLLIVGSGKTHFPSAPPQDILNEVVDYDLVCLVESSCGDRAIGRMGRYVQLRCGKFVALAKKVEEGATLSDAMKSMPKYFPAYIAKMVQIGEEKQNLDEMFDRVIAYLKWQYLGIDTPVQTPVPA